MSSQAHAQTGPYENTSSTSLNESVAPCAGTHLTRNITVGDSFIIGDVNLGLLITHTYRGDIQTTLTSPAGTTVTLVSPDGGNGLQNYNVEFDDEAGNDVNTSPHNTSDGISAPPYENPVRPIGNLSDFDGENAQGSWVLDMCDNFNADSGTFQRANLYFTGATDADVSLAISVSDTTPDQGTNVVLTYTMSNAGGLAATGLSADIVLPSGLSYLSDNGGGTYNTGTGIWAPSGSLASGSSISLQITAYVETSGNYATTVDLASSDQTDPDSTPGNGNTSEDDYDALTLVPTVPAVPPLSCPGAPSVLDWQTVNWPTGSLSNNYTVDGYAISMTVTDPLGALTVNPVTGQNSPAEATTLTGGFTPAESNVHIFADQASQSGAINVAFGLGTGGEGVSQFQVTLFDVDFGSSQFQDQLTISGSLGGSPVTPTLISSSANSTSGSVATGNAPAGSTSANGNITIEFSSAVDSVAISYSNGGGAPTNPGLQAMGVHDFKFCPVVSAELTGSKTVAVWDPGATGLYALPGNDVVYTISALNIGDGPSDDGTILLIDPIPSDVEFYNGDIDDGGPETDPVSFTQSGAGLTFNYATHVAYSNAAPAPADFASCTYSPSSGYDPNVTYICINPDGAMAAGDPDPSFSVSFRARIK